jgi:hypothetical protein
MKIFSEIFNPEKFVFRASSQLKFLLSHQALRPGGAKGGLHFTWTIIFTKQNF